MPKRSVRRPKHVFVSYAHEDRRFAQQLSRRLRDSRRVPWQDIRNLRLGVEWQKAIDDALRGAEALVVVLSPAATKSQYVTYEWAFALGAGVRVIPVIRKPTEIHPRLRNIQYADFTTRRGTPWLDLLKALPSRAVRTHATPQIAAQVKLVNDKPEISRNYYSIWVYLKNVPRGVARVMYEAHDETLAERKWQSKSAAQGFQVEILANGDFLVSATLRLRSGKELRIASGLSEALLRGEGRTPTPPVARHVMKQLARHKKSTKRDA